MGPTTPLRRNRDFVLLESGRLLSSLGSQSTAIAYPLLVLALTHSPARAGIVGFARLVPIALLSIPAGVAADRWSRRRLMLGADCVRAAAIGSLAALVLADRAAFAAIVVVALVEGAGSVVFGVAQAGALKAVVPARQLPAAVGAQQVRGGVVGLVGPTLGGALFAVGRAVPFLLDCASYVCSLASLAAMRTPFQQPRERDPAPLRARVAEGFAFVWGQPFVRATTILYALGNVTIPALLLVAVVAGRRQGLSSGEIGALLSVVGAALLAGSLLSPLGRRSLSARAIVLLESSLALCTAAFLLRPSVWVLVAALVPQLVVIPVTDSVVVGYRVALTPDRLLGRAESVRSAIARLIDPLGPLAAGLLLSAVSPRATVAAVVAWSAALLVWAALSPALREAPSLDELPETAAP